jgi:hypothetical protein
MRGFLVPWRRVSRPRPTARQRCEGQAVIPAHAPGRRSSDDESERVRERCGSALARSPQLSVRVPDGRHRRRVQPRRGRHAALSPHRRSLRGRAQRRAATHPPPGAADRRQLRCAQPGRGHRPRLLGPRWRLLAARRAARPSHRLRRTTRHSSRTSDHASARSRMPRTHPPAAAPSRHARALRSAARKRSSGSTTRCLPGTRSGPTLRRPPDGGYMSHSPPHPVSLP